MKIDLHLPRTFDASVAFDPATNVITITPNNDRGVVPLIGVEVTSKNGKRKKRSAINFDLGNGMPVLTSKRQSKAGESFDDRDEDPEDTGETEADEKETGAT